MIEDKMLREGLSKLYKYWDVITIKLGPEAPRVCDYCSRRLVEPGGIVVKRSYLTRYGMMCGYCVKDIEAVCIYEPNQDVSEEFWYKGSYPEPKEGNSDRARK